MKLSEMHKLADETLDLFLQTMPNPPFVASDIVFSFARKSEMASRAQELCSLYCPEKILNDSQLLDVGESVAANAFIGRKKSAVLVRIINKINERDFRRIIAHELAHIYCGLKEVKVAEGHFIDTFGSGTTYDVSQEDMEYDGFLVSGYEVWSEFIAQYYAIKLIDTKPYLFVRAVDYISKFMRDVTVDELHLSKSSFSIYNVYFYLAYFSREL